MCNLICAIAFCSKRMSSCYLRFSDEELRLEELPTRSHHDVEEPRPGRLLLMGSGILYAGPSPIHPPPTPNYGSVKRNRWKQYAHIPFTCLLFKMPSSLSVASPKEVNLPSGRHHFQDLPAGGAVASQKFRFASCLWFCYFPPTLLRVFIRSLFTFIKLASDIHHWIQFIILHHLSIVFCFVF